MTDIETHARQFTKPECEELLRNIGYDNRAPSDYNAILRLYETIGKCGRGFALRGINGIGKTMVARALLKSNCFDDERTVAFTMNNQDKNLATVPGVSWRNMPPNGIWVYLDDVGMEEGISDFGIRYESFSKAVQRIYNMRQNGMKVRLVLTTNLSDLDMLQRYGTHIVDRIDDLVVWLTMEGRGYSERKRMEIKA